MKIINSITSFILLLLFLKEYNFDEEKKQIIKKKSFYFLVIWVVFIIFFMFGLTHVIENIPENIGLLITLLFLLLFSIYHWFLMIKSSQFLSRHIIYFILLLPMTFLLIWNLVLWNKPTYYGAMDGFANVMTAQMQITIIVILPTFLFALRMTKIKNQLKGFWLLFITLYSGIMGVKLSIGKEGYLSDSTGYVFMILIIALIIVSVYLIKNFTQVRIKEVRI